MKEQFPRTAALEERTYEKWVDALNNRNRDPVSPVDNHVALRKSVQNKIIADLIADGVEASALAAVTFEWKRSSPFDVFIKAKGEEQQVDIIRRYFLHALIPENGKHNSFWAKMGQLELHTPGATAIALQADNYTDLAKAVGAAPALTVLSDEIKVQR